MPLGLTMHGKWDGISMASPTLHAFKHERPAYSTPHPVENTPANNECRMVDLRGAKVASFFVGGDEFICLPQAFDLFLKHLVGGLHTVYTKLKRLSISPVVCNVEQVRILRGLGAIQPGVNRCKLITRKDFEILYLDCTQASRPGRPPKRYPMLPPTADLMAHHAGMRSMNAAHGLLGAPDFSSLQKRMRLEQDLDKHLHQRQERRMSDSPTEDSSSITGKDLAISRLKGAHANAAEMYIQAQQALRRQYQQVAASNMHNGLEGQHVATVAGLNPALAPLMMMSHAGMFPGGLPSSSMSVLNHINQFAQNFGSGNAATTAAAVAAQFAAKDGSMHQQVAAAQAAYQAAVAAQSAAQAVAATANTTVPRAEDRHRSDSVQDEKYSDSSEQFATPRLSMNNHANSRLTNGTVSDGCASPHSSTNSVPGEENGSEGRLSLHSDSSEAADDNGNSRPQSANGVHCDGKSNPGHNTARENGAANTPDNRDRDETIAENAFAPLNSEQTFSDDVNLSSMQTLLTNIQGLLKVAADNASLQEKHCSFEIADLKAKVSKERQIRGTVEKKFQESERIRSLVQKRLKEERKARKVLQEQILTIRRQLEVEEETANAKAETFPATSEAISPTAALAFTVSSMQQYSPPSSIRYSTVQSPVAAGDIISPSIASYTMTASSPPDISPQTATIVDTRIVSQNNSNNSSNIDSASPHPRVHCTALPQSSLCTARQPCNSDRDMSNEIATTKSDHAEHQTNLDQRIYFRASHFNAVSSQ